MVKKTASQQTGLIRWSRTWNTQKPPYTHPLAFGFSSSAQSQYPGVKAGNTVKCAMYSFNERRPGSMIVYEDHARNAAYSNFMNAAKGGANAALGLTIVEWRSSLTMIANALEALRNKKKNARFYYRRKKVSELYLEGLFGWLPLMQDIYQGLEILSRRRSTSMAYGRGNTVWTDKLSTANLKCVKVSNHHVRMGGRLEMTNPNVALLGDLGILNPLAVAWDKVPYSFVLNWFLPVGQYLSSMSDLYGYLLRDGYTTTSTETSSSGSLWVTTPEGHMADRWVRKFGVGRAPGVPSPVFPSPRMPTADLVKACIALSLFDQQLPDRPLPRKPRGTGQLNRRFWRNL